MLEKLEQLQKNKIFSQLYPSKKVNVLVSSRLQQIEIRYRKINCLLTCVLPIL